MKIRKTIQDMSEKFSKEIEILKKNHTNLENAELNKSNKT
jgi:hypothetical protein